jgi:hypothetical protein
LQDSGELIVGRQVPSLTGMPNSQNSRQSALFTNSAQSQKRLVMSARLRPWRFVKRIFPQLCGTNALSPRHTVSRSPAMSQVRREPSADFCAQLALASEKAGLWITKAS